MKKHWDKTNEKTALEKAKSGLLLFNQADISVMAGQSVNLLPPAPLAATDCDGAEAFVQKFFNAATRLSGKKKCPHRDSFTFAALAIMASEALMPAPVPEYHCCP